MASKKSQKTEDVYLKAFRQFDQNGDGYISLREMREALTAAGSKLTDQQIYEFFMYNDEDKDHRITYAEFQKGVKAIIDFTQKAKALFEELDKSGDGYLDKNELRALFQRLGHNLPENELQQILNEADKNRDNKISFEEFIDACT